MAQSPSEIEKKTRLKELWMLLFGNPINLTDPEIERLLESEKELRTILHFTYSGFPHQIERVKKHHAKKKELSELPTEKLVEMKCAIEENRLAVLRSTNEEELSDSFFEAPPIDSNEHILNEILKERGVDWRK
ncbi:MAG TPA: hypothetical protein ENI19_01140 [Candidatus Nealsonbacteria bacterium]|uniref:Uncharacterized protein n=1 Tax=marine sediment metagenome TaxID=412755 RepID=A0A0F9VC32_9ZZZZ|nr:hypothetical protein [Candidatus Nealsonbacteria bacterium]HEB46298.1 hypothetical protein [Candidatus Nealsonbacteria bacterium]